MRFNYFLLILIICCLLSACKKENNDTIITGYVTGVEPGTVIKLSKFDGFTFNEFQSDTITKEDFKFTIIDSISNPQLLMLTMVDETIAPTSLELWIAPGSKTEIKGRDKYYAAWEVKNDVPEQVELNRYKDRTRDYDRNWQSLLSDTYPFRTAIESGAEITLEMEREFMLKMDSVATMERLIEETRLEVMHENKTYSPVWMDEDVGRLCGSAPI
jgi:hypothetical protein